MLSKDEIGQELARAGIESGDTVLLHSDIGHLFDQNRGQPRRSIANELLDGVLERLGPEGTLVTPTFTYGFCRGQPFDIDKTPSDVGFFSNVVLTHPRALRSRHAIFSIAVIGNNAEFICNDLSTDAFAEQGAFARLYQLDAKQVFLSSKLEDHCTYLHYVEQKMGVSYRFIKQFPGTVVVDGIARDEVHSFFARPLDGSVKTDLGRMNRELLSKGLLRRVSTRLGEIESISTVALTKFTIDKLRHNETYMLGQS